MQGPFVHHISDQDIEKQDHAQDQNKQRNRPYQHNNDQDDGEEHRKNGVNHQFRKLGIGTHEFGSLTDQRAAEPVAVKSHGLIGQGVKTGGGQIVAGIDFQFPAGVVLQFGADLPHNVDDNQRCDIGAEDRKDLIGRNRSGSHPVDNASHVVAVGIGQQSHIPQGGQDPQKENEGMGLCHCPEIVQGSAGGGCAVCFFHQSFYLTFAGHGP